LKSALVTEKTSKDVVHKKYVFAVEKAANAIEIKRAVENIYKVKVDSVNTLIVKGKFKRVRWNQPGRTTAWKKAIVTLKDGFEIKLA
jgi:large subunit ribosomal protein L23